jgi:hypothetical protein
MTAISAPIPGQTFGAFAIESVVGIGGMGVVYRARDATRGGLVALKLLRSRDGSPPSDEARARFVREARLAAALAHRNIVGIVASGAVGTVPYIAMEWIEGTTLGERAADGAFDTGQRIEVLARVADALAYAHQCGVVHRDLKPSNVMVQASGEPKLVDFGIAKQARDASQPLALAHTQAGGLATRTGVLLGTPSYMAPEQMLSPDVDARVDQFAWGVLAYELLAGVHPRETVAPGDATFPVGRASPLAWHAPGVPEPVAAIVHRAMAYERDARFPDMTELAHALRASRGADTTGALGPVAVPSTYASAPAPGLAGPSTSPPATGARTSAGATGTVLAAAAVVAVLGGAIVATRMASGAPLPVAVPGYRTVELVKGFEDVPFAGDAAGRTAATDAVHRRLRPCIDGRMEADDAVSLDIDVGVDGKVTSVGTPNYCRRETAHRYFCTELGDPVKRGHPTPPPGMLECLRDAAKTVSLPPLVTRKRAKFEDPELPGPETVHLDLEAR